MLKQPCPELDWACTEFPAETVECISDEPWSKVFKLSGPVESVYLKLVPPHKADALCLNTLVNQYFPTNTPKGIAFNPVMSALVMADHGGIALQGSREEAEGMLVTYADMQAKAGDMPGLLAALPELSAESLFVNFIEFTNVDSPLYKSAGKAQAQYFLGEQDSANYHRLLSSRMHLLQAYVEQAAALKVTLNHGDLRLPNAAVKQGQTIIFDWDEARAGPVGTSLYSLFGGCAPLFLLSHNLMAYASEHENEQFAQLFNVYAEALSQRGHGEFAHLYKALPAAATLGVMQYIVSFADYAVPDTAQREVIAANIRSSLDDLLALCDLLSLQNQQHPLAYAQDYLETGYFTGVEHTAKRYLNIVAPGSDTYDVQKLLLQALLAQNKVEESSVLVGELLKLAPNDADLLYLQGNLFADKMEYQQALQCYNKAAVYAPERADIRGSIDFTGYLNQTVRFAAEPHNPPTLELPPDWQQSVDQNTLETLSRLGLRLFEQYGALVIRNLFAPELIAGLQQSFTQNYAASSAAHEENAAVLSVGDGRYMLSIDIEGAFNQAGIYASPFLLSLFGKLFAGDFNLGSYTAVTALAEAGEQHLHKDRENLFSGHATPCFAATVLVPLVSTNAQVGGTRIYKNSQLLSLEDTIQLPAQDVYANPGDCLLFDYRLSHQGMANASDSERPVLSLVYQRPWFQDVVNFDKQPPIRMKREQYKKVPANLRALFAEPTE